MNNTLCMICCLSAKHGGLGIMNSTRKAIENFDVSKKSSRFIVDSFVNAIELDAGEGNSHVHRTR